MVIKPLQTADIPKIVKIHKRCIKITNAKTYNPEIIEAWLSQINEDNVIIQLNSTSWIAITTNEGLVGFAQYCIEDAELYQIQIDPKYQGQGFGKKLYKYIEQEFINAKTNKIALNATLNAVPFYTSLGFANTGNICFDGIDMVKMEKTLK